jgi:PPOX class probable F420-dependent enzyme
MIEGRFAELIAGQRQGVLVTLRKDGWPQLSNVNYAWYPQEQIIRISTTDDRAKTGNMRRDPRVSFHVTTGDFWSYVVVDGIRTTRPWKNWSSCTARSRATTPTGTTTGRPWSATGAWSSGCGPSGPTGWFTAVDRQPNKRNGRLRRAKPGFRCVDGRRNEHQ